MNRIQLRGLLGSGSLLDGLSALPAFALAIVGLSMLAGRNLPNPDFWWDEAGQFWMSQGQNHSSTYQTPESPLAQGIEFGRNGYNLDPLGFTALLRVWSVVFGSDPVALRSLPFLFFVATILLSVWLGKNIFSLPWLFAVGIPLASVAWYIPMQYATELRPYSLELLGVVTIGGLVIAVVSSRSGKYVVLLSAAILAFSMASRYSISIAVGAAIVTLLIATLTQSQKSWSKVLWPGLAACVAAVFFAWNIGLFGGGRQTSPSYTASLDLLDSWTFTFVGTTLYDNLVQSNQIAITFLLLAALVVLALRRWGGARRGRRTTLRELSSISSPWMAAALFVACYELVAVVASAAGFTPWNATARWSIGLHGLVILAGMGIIFLGLSVLKVVVPKVLSRVAARNDKSIIFAGLLMVMLGLLIGAVAYEAILVSAKRLGAFQRDSYQQVANPLIDATRLLERSRVSEDFALVSEDLWPSVRMLWETPASEIYDLWVPANARSFSSQEDIDVVLKSAADVGFLCATGQTLVVLKSLTPQDVSDVTRQVGALRPDWSCQVTAIAGNPGIVVLSDSLNRL